MSSLLILAALILVALVCSGAFAALRYQARAYDRKEQMLLTQISQLLDRAQYASGHAWTLPPHTVDEPDVPEREEIHARRRMFIPDPEAMVDPDQQFELVSNADLV